MSCGSDVRDTDVAAGAQVTAAITRSRAVAERAGVTGPAGGDGDHVMPVQQHLLPPQELLEPRLPRLLPLAQQPGHQQTLRQPLGERPTMMAFQQWAPSPFAAGGGHTGAHFGALLQAPHAQQFATPPSGAHTRPQNGTLVIGGLGVVLVQTVQVNERGSITRHVEAGRVIEAQGLALQVERDAELAHMLEDGAVNIVFVNPEEEHTYWHVTIWHPRCPFTQ
ncbi:hypothetical protein T492DRAFT_868056 [Pavlovales sp. CCMP2436]|nr:hypothetical protein T492DRAFT_868056 [Pavlovales sp. CCMP2436]